MNRRSIQLAICCIVPVFGVIGLPLLLYGGLNIPSNLTKEEAWVAGTNQLEALEAKKKASTAYLQMVIGGGFTAVALSVCCLHLLVVIVRPEFLVHPDDEEEEASRGQRAPQGQILAPDTPSQPAEQV
jgi:hypothetical protein